MDTFIWSLRANVCCNMRYIGFLSENGLQTFELKLRSLVYCLQFVQNCRTVSFYCRKEIGFSVENRNDLRFENIRNVGRSNFGGNTQEPGVCFIKISNFIVTQKQTFLEISCFHVLTSYYSAHHARI